MVPENKLRKRAFGLRDRIEGGRKSHSGEFDHFDSSPNIIRLMRVRVRWVLHVARIGEINIAYRISD